MKIFRWREMNEEEKERLLRRAELDITQQMEVVMNIVNEVKKDGNKALCRFMQQFDQVSLTPKSLKVTAEEIDRGYERVSETFRGTLRFAVNNIRKFHAQQMPKPLWLTETAPGVMVGEQTNPIPDVCIYVPRGKGSFPSVLLMLAIPALVAGVPRVVVVTPPNSEGNLDDAVLAAAKVAGVSEIYKVGGAQGVAAIAYGTETIPRLSKIIGPGNSYVTAAKRILSGILDVGSPAGPSEAIILADETADPQKVALDLMIEAEHGPDSASLLVTHEPTLAEKVPAIIENQLAKLSERRRNFVSTVFNNFGGIIITESLEESVDVVNRYGPEHMEIMTRDPWAVLPKIKNAGEILLGPNSPITLANFLLGPNAILPTGGFARTYSGVSVLDFLKRSSVGYVTETGFQKLKDMAALFARQEGFEAHALAVEER